MVTDINGGKLRLSDVQRALIDYNGGFPTFSIEKPMALPWAGGNGYVKEMQDSGLYSSELKLNEHRGFITIGKDGKAVFFSYRGPKENAGIVGDCLKSIEQLGLPQCTVLDGGQFFRKELKESKLWVFDVLVWGGQKVRTSWKERRAILDEKIPRGHKNVWMPPLCWNFQKEFQDMLGGKSKYIKEFLDEHNLKESFSDQIEGLVIKKLDGKLSFPLSKREVSTFYKLRMADVIK